MPRHRPNVFDRGALEQSLRLQGCAESFIPPTISDFRLFVPLVFRHLGEEQLLAIVEGAGEELGLRPQHGAWQAAAKYIVGWAEGELADYVQQGRTGEPV